LDETLYSVEWSGDQAVGEAIANVLTDELRKRSIRFRVEYTRGTVPALEFNSEEEVTDEEESYRSVLVPKDSLNDANNAFNFVLRERRAELKMNALEIARARRLVGSEEDLEEYEKHLADAFGW